MSNVGLCVIKHLGAKSPIAAYKSEMSEDVADLVAGGTDKDAAWLQVIDAKLLNLGAEKARIEQSVADAYGQTAAGKVAAPASVEQAAQEAPAPVAEVATITDVGEKIGGARKDMAVSGGTKRKAATDERPAWARRFQISQIVTPGGMVGEVKDAGRWMIRDTRSLDWTGQAKQVGRDTYATKEEAEAVVPVAAVSLKHRAVPSRDGKYEIWRDITDRKRVKVVEQQFDSRDDAMRYMLVNAVQIIETSTTFGEADLPTPPDRARTGPQRRTGNVNGQDFKDAFGLRGVEFGNWNNQDERQSLMNDAWDGLLDLADVLGVPPKALGMNGDLALAFGARGHGLQSARAHYEPARAVINLTKESGAGSLAHEWFHALDHYFGRQDGKASATWKVQADGTRTLDVQGDGAEMVSSGFRGDRSGVRAELRQAYDAMLRTMTKKAETYVEDTAKADRFVATSREELASALAGLRRDLAEQKDPKYWKRNNKPASAEQLAEFDAITKQMVDGDVSALATDWRTMLKGGDKPASSRGASMAVRWTNDTLERVSAIYKEVRGRSGFDGTNKQGVMDRLRGNMDRYSQRLKMLADAQAETGKVRAVPTDFAMNARELDQGRGTDYWTTPHEMAARAFQGYVEDKIAERGGVSRFLNYAPENSAILTPWGFKRPYPAGEERKAINAAFDKFIGAIQTRADDAGNVTMFSRASDAGADVQKVTPVVEMHRATYKGSGGKWADLVNAIVAKNPGTTKDTISSAVIAAEIVEQFNAGTLPGSALWFEVRDALGDASFSRNGRLGIPLPDAQAVAAKIRLALPKAPPIIVHETVDKAPAALLEDIRAAGAMNDVEAAYHAGSIHVFPQHMASVERMEFVVAHHEVRHHGLRAILGDKFGATMLAMRNSNPALKAAAQAKMDAGLAGSTVQSVDEALADMPLEELAKLTGFDKLVAAIRQWLRMTAFRLRKAGFGGVADAINPKTWTDRDVAAFVLKAELVSRDGGPSVQEQGTVFGRAATADLDRAWRDLTSANKFSDFDTPTATKVTGTVDDFVLSREEGGQWAALNVREFTRDDGTTVYSSSLEVGLEGFPKGTGAASAMYLQALKIAQRRGMGWQSEGIRSDAAMAIYNRLTAAGVPFEGDGNASLVSAEALAGVDLKQVASQMAEGREPAAFSRATPAAARDEAGRFKRDEPGAGPGVAQKRTVQQKVRNTFADIMGDAGAKVSWWDKTLGTQYAKAQKFPDTFGRVFNAAQQYTEDTSSLANEAADKAKTILPKLETWKDLKNFGIKDADAKALAAPIFTGTLTDKRVYDDAELVSRYKLTPAQIGQYREFMAAVNTSLDQAVAAEVVKLIGDKNPALRELAISDRAALRRGVDEYLTELADAGDEKAAETLSMVRDKYERIDNLKSEGYAPLMRFGKYKIHIVEPDTGATLFFGLYETKAAANNMARDLADDPEFRGARFERGVLSQEQYKLFSAMPLDSLEMFAAAMGVDESEAFQQYIKIAKSNRSALKRLIERKGTAGFSEDVPRVLASFVTSNARMASAAMNLPTAKQAAQDIRDGDVQDEAIKLIDAVQNPGETAGVFRGLMFMNFIGGSIASAFVNLTQPLTMTLPYLSQFGGGTKAAARLMSAGKMVASGKVADLGLRLALKRAESGGIVSPQEIHHLTAQAMGTYGTNPWLRNAAFIWAAPFSLAEQFNRRVTFIAAYMTAKEQGIADPEAFADKAVTETQGLYNKGNAPNWSRSAIGASALTFKQFSIHYLEWMQRMYRSGPEGKKAVLLALALLVLAAGTDGLPGADDLDDLIDTLGQALGYDMNAKKSRRDFIANTLGLGDTTADVFARGMSALPGIPMDVSLRMSGGNLVPGSGLLLRSNTDRSRDLLEIAGPAGGLAKQYIDASQKALRGDFGGAAEGAMPVAIQNVSKAVGMWATGEARDTQGRRVMEADTVDGLMRFLGFNPQAIARESDKMGMIRRSEQLAKNVEGEIAAEWARAKADGDSEGVADARQRLAEWNESNPEQRIKITQTQIMGRVMKLRKDRASRFITSVSPERRQAVEDALQ